MSHTNDRIATELPMLNTRAAARFLGLSPATLNTQRSRGRGPAFVRLGRAIRYRRCDLEAYLAARTVDPESTTDA